MVRWPKTTQRSGKLGNRLELMANKDSKGFTLVELMVGIAIVAIIAAFALPAYQGQAQKGRRADGTSLLSEIAQLQERFKLENGTYTTNLASLGYTLSGGAAVTDKEHYKITVETPAGCGISNCFRLLAQTNSTQQTDDGDLRLLSDGTKQRNSGGAWVTGWN